MRVGIDMLLLKQELFARLFSILLGFADVTGHQVTIGECFRPPETARLYESQGRGVENSLHTLRLACDLNLYVDGRYQTDTEAYRVLGEYWESLGGSWGGDFGDGNHFSIEHEGVR